MAAKEKQYVSIWTPPGILSFPYLASVDSGRQYSDDAYKTDLLIYKPTFKDKGKELQEKVLEVGRAQFGSSFKLKGGKQRSPFKDTDDDSKITLDAMKGAIQIRAKSGPRKKGTQIIPARRPIVIGPRMVNGKFPEWDLDQIREIKGGDWAVLKISIFAYTQKSDGFDGGVTFGLQAVQFWKAGEALGQGKSALLETAQELEEEIDAAQNADIGDSDEDGSNDLV